MQKPGGHRRSVRSELRTIFPNFNRRRHSSSRAGSGGSDITFRPDVCPSKQGLTKETTPDLPGEQPHGKLRLTSSYHRARLRPSCSSNLARKRGAAGWLACHFGGDDLLGGLRDAALAHMRCPTRATEAPHPIYPSVSTFARFNGPVDRPELEVGAT